MRLMDGVRQLTTEIDEFVLNGKAREKWIHIFTDPLATKFPVVNGPIFQALANTAISPFGFLFPGATKALHFSLEGKYATASAYSLSDISNLNALVEAFKIAFLGAPLISDVVLPLLHIEPGISPAAIGIVSAILAVIAVRGAINVAQNTSDLLFFTKKPDGFNWNDNSHAAAITGIAAFTHGFIKNINNLRPL